MKGTLENGLYLLVGNVVYGTTTTVAKQVLDNTSLCNKRLTHISECGM